MMNRVDAGFRGSTAEMGLKDSGYDIHCHVFSSKATNRLKTTQQLFPEKWRRQCEARRGSGIVGSTHPKP